MTEGRMDMNPHEILKRLGDNGYEAYYVGGYVRDYLLNKKAKDIDITTKARPPEIIKLFNDCRVELVGKSFGVVIVDETEVATFRIDRYGGLSNKNVEITYADTIEQDLQRRDLTINAMAMNINGWITDCSGGISDLRKGIIRFVGNPSDRILEDPNRIVRACRFYASFKDTTFDPDTLKALLHHRYLVTYIAPERIQKEIMKVVSTIQEASEFFIGCKLVKILEYIFPTLQNCVGITQNRYHKEELFVHHMLVGDNISCRHPLIKLTGYLHDVGKAIVKEYNEKKGDYTFYDHDKVGAELIEQNLQNLRFSSTDITFITALIKAHMRPIKVGTLKGYRRLLKYFSDSNINYKDFIRLRLADRKGTIDKRPPFFAFDIREVIRGFRGVLERKEAFGLKQLEVNGTDVMKALQIKPSRRVGTVLNDLLIRVIDNPTLNEHITLIKMIKNEY